MGWHYIFNKNTTVTNDVITYERANSTIVKKENTKQEFHMLNCLIMVIIL